MPGGGNSRNDGKMERLGYFLHNVEEKLGNLTSFLLKPLADKFGTTVTVLGFVILISAIIIFAAIYIAEITANSIVFPIGIAVFSVIYIICSIAYNRVN